MKFSIIIFFLTVTLSSAMAQDLSDYRWQNRILLILTNEISQEDVDKQISAIRTNMGEMEERKLVTFIITPDKSYMGFTFDKWLSNYTLYKKYKVTKAPFEMVLIGLDGGVKERYTAYEALENIFAIIDGMPMRRSELTRKKEGSDGSEQK